MLCFLAAPMPYAKFEKAQPCAENSALAVLNQHDLAFPLQSRFTDRWRTKEWG
jgi:hypothetical protein